MKHNKLVRDNIPQIIKDSWRITITHIASNSEYWNRLKEKLQEEVNEFLENTDNNEELADILEVIHAILNFKWIKFEELEKIRLEKQKKNGGFKNKIILEETK